MLIVPSNPPAMNMAATAKKTRVRKANFSAEEVSLMLQEIATEKGILLSQLTNEATNRRKNAIRIHPSDTGAMSVAMNNLFSGGLLQPRQDFS